MPVVEEFSGDESLTINWTIEKYSLNSLPQGKCFISPNFESKRLGDSRWRLELFPRGSIYGDFIACYIWYEAEDTTCEVDTYSLTLSLRIGDCDLFRKSKMHTFQGTDCWQCHDFIKIEDFKRTKLPDDEFKIQYKLRPENNTKRSDLQDIQYLSRDLISLLESEKDCDLILITDDNTRFKVHKCIMSVRWPNLKEYMEMISEREGKVHAIHTHILKTMIRYAYSGILNETNVPREMFKAAVNYDFKSLRKNLSCFPKAYYGITELNIEHKVVVWHLEDITSWDRTPMSFIRVLPIIELYVYEIILAFSIKKDAEGDDVIDVAFRFSYFKNNFPIFLSCKMCLSVQGGGVTGFKECQHLFLNKDTWHFPQPIKKIDIPDKKWTLMTLELTMTDGAKSSRIDRTETEFFTNFTPICDLRKLSTDLSTLSFENGNHPHDCLLEAESGRQIPAHRIILWTRWPQMRSILDIEVDDIGAGWTIQTNIEETALMAIIMYVYAGTSEEISIATAEKILETKGIVQLPVPLLQKCKSILENERSAE